MLLQQGLVWRRVFWKQWMTCWTGRGFAFAVLRGNAGSERLLERHSLDDDDYIPL